MTGRPLDDVNTCRPRARSTDVEKEGDIDSRFGVKGRHVVADRLARKLSARQVQMIGWSDHDCSYLGLLLIMILQQSEEPSVLASFLGPESHWQ